MLSYDRSRNTWNSDAASFTDDDGTVRAWDASTYEYVTTLRASNTRAPMTEERSQ